MLFVKLVYMSSLNLYFSLWCEFVCLCVCVIYHTLCVLYLSVCVSVCVFFLYNVQYLLRVLPPGAF